MCSRTLAIGAVLATILSADVLTTRSGRKVDGVYLGGNARQVRMEVQDRIETFEIGDVESIRFGDAAPVTAAPKPGGAVVQAPEIARTATTPVPAAAPAPAPGRTAAGRLEVPAGTSLVIRLIDDIDSERDRVGQTYRASVDESVTIGEETAIPRGADVTVRLVEDKQSGKLTGKTELTLDVESISVNGRQLEVATETVTQASESRTRQTAKVAGGTAALGAIIGAIAGGGKGAAIGAVTGAAAGGAVQVITKGQRVRIPSETRLSFTLQSAVRI